MPSLNTIIKNQNTLPDLSLPRCFWCNMKNPVYISYHDNEWGRMPKCEHDLYELFILETFQAGLSWECILNKRENLRAAFDGFDIDKVCSFDEQKTEELMKNPGIIRNRAKIKACIGNSRIYKSITEEYGSFQNYLKSFTGGTVTKEPNLKITTSPLSDAISGDLKHRGMKFVGSVTIYAFLQAVGIVKAHTENCFLYE